MNPFSRLSVGLLYGSLFASVVALVVLLAADHGPRPVLSAGADSFSRSALGHSAFVETLERCGIPVLVSRFQSAERTRRSGLLLVLEPRDAGSGALRDLVDRANRTLVVLPKREGDPAPRRPGHLATTRLLPVGAPQAVLAELGLEGRVVRVEFPGAPAVAGPRQLVAGANAGPRNHWFPAGAFLFEARTPDGAECWILADPDPVENHGLGAAGNAEYLVALVDRLRDGGPVIVDETLHGYERAPRRLGALGRFPLVLVLWHGALVVALLFFAAGRRFGKPAPEEAESRGTLLESAVALLSTPDRTAALVNRYRRTVLAGARPGGRSEDFRAELVERAGEPASEEELLDLARRMHEEQRERGDGRR